MMRRLLCLALLLPAAAAAQPLGSLDVTRHGIVYRVPGMDAVKVRKNIALEGAPRFDLYLPPRARGKLPVVVFVNGVGDGGHGKLKDWEIYKDWARLVAARGTAAILHEAAPGRVAADLAALFDRLAAQGAGLGIDPARIAMWACSANVTPAVALAMDGKPRGLVAAVFYYGAGNPKEIRTDLPVHHVLAGKDGPGLLQGQRALFARVVAAGAPWNMVLAPTLPHAFDALDLSPESLRAVHETLAFLDAHLRPLPAPPAPTRGRQILAYSYGQEQDKAVRALEELLAERPGDVEATWALATAHRNDGRPADAERMYRRVGELEPDKPRSSMWLAILRADARDCAGAAPHFARAAEQAAGMVHFATAKAACEIAGGDRAAGEKTLARAVSAGADAGLLHYNTACRLALAARPDDALTELERSVEAGYRDGAWIARDEDLVSLRDKPRFKALLAKLGQGT
jgi:acetyl esterase/lipase